MFLQRTRLQIFSQSLFQKRLLSTWGRNWECYHSHLFTKFFKRSMCSGVAIHCLIQLAIDVKGGGVETRGAFQSGGVIPVEKYELVAFQDNFFGELPSMTKEEIVRIIVVIDVKGINFSIMSYCWPTNFCQEKNQIIHIRPIPS